VLRTLCERLGCVTVPDRVDTDKAQDVRASGRCGGDRRCSTPRPLDACKRRCTPACAVLNQFDDEAGAACGGGHGEGAIAGERVAQYRAARQRYGHRSAAVGNGRGSLKVSGDRGVGERRRSGEDQVRAGRPSGTRGRVAGDVVERCDAGRGGVGAPVGDRQGSCQGNCTRRSG